MGPLIFILDKLADTIAVVVQNQQNNAVTFKLTQGGKAAKITLPDHSIATFTYANF